MLHQDTAYRYKCSSHECFCRWESNPRSLAYEAGLSPNAPLGQNSVKECTYLSKDTKMAPRLAAIVGMQVRMTIINILVICKRQLVYEQVVVDIYDIRQKAESNSNSGGNSYQITRPTTRACAALGKTTLRPVTLAVGLRPFACDEKRKKHKYTSFCSRLLSYPPLS